MRATFKVCLFTGALFALSVGVAQAQQRRGWVPQAAWNAAKERAKLDLGSQQIKLYKSGWSRSVSRGLRSAGMADAYIVHARRLQPRAWAGKTKGSYLVQKSSQGIYEAYPLSPDGRGKHISTVESRRDASLHTMADGGFPPSKMVHGVKVTNAGSVMPRLGSVVARKRSGRNTTVFVLGEPNKSGNGAAAQLEMYPRIPIFRQEPAPSRTVPPGPGTRRLVNVHFDQVFYAQHR